MDNFSHYFHTLKGVYDAFNYSIFNLCFLTYRKAVDNFLPVTWTTLESFSDLLASLRSVKKGIGLADEV